MTCCTAKKGFTLIELIVSTSIIFTIFAFAGISLLNIIPDAGLREAMHSFSADARSQQDLAMMGQASLSLPVPYGIHIEPGRYIVFTGTTYTPDDELNYVVELPENIMASTTFPDQSITFLPLTGDVKDYDPLTNQVVFSAPSNHSFVLRINKLGTIYYVNKL